MHLIPVLAVCIQMESWSRGNHSVNQSSEYLCPVTGIRVNLINLGDNPEYDEVTCDLKIKIQEGILGCRGSDFSHRQYCAKGSDIGESGLQFTLNIDEPNKCESEWKAQIVTFHSLNNNEIGKLAVETLFVYLGLRICDHTNLLETSNRTLYTHCCAWSSKKMNISHMLKSRKIVKRRINCLPSVRNDDESTIFACIFIAVTIFIGAFVHISIRINGYEA